jgi:type I restriction enzyme S subunit
MNLLTVKKIHTALPPPSEQSRIGQALSNIDSLICSIEQLIHKKLQVKQAAMQELLTGKRRLPGFMGEWEARELGSLGIWRGGMTPSMQNPDYWNQGDFPWISSGDVKLSRLSDTSQHVTAHAVSSGAAVVIPVKSIVLVTRSGILRKHLPVAFLNRPMAINQDIKALIPARDIDSCYLLHALTWAGSQILISCMKTGTTVESIEFSWLKKFTILIPSHDEQVAIATALSEMESELLDLEARKDKAKMLKQGMMQQLLTGKIRLT